MARRLIDEGCEVALVVLLVSLYFGYALGLPATSRWVAAHLPDSVERHIGD